MHFTRNDQDTLKSMALDPTGSAGWMKDAIAFGARPHDGAEIAAVAVFQNFRAHDAELHFAMIDGRRISVETVKAMLMIAFSPRALGLTRLWAHISAANVVAQAAALKVGFEFEARIRGGSADGASDVIVFSMLRAGPRQPLPGAIDNSNA